MSIQQSYAIVSPAMTDTREWIWNAFKNETLEKTVLNGGHLTCSKVNKVAPE